ncbi:MAG: tRNA pseudouridine(55) synthase TruB [Erysipelotrichaceae bacterium]|nr:tRNA pseudouridine(55) synthase TruB [Erysipelotrichaceae bacterium]MBR2746228.1 tRNA pseudouridine(55) synthase TruB [Erysipelotrichaceae bacterium]
MNGILLVNKPQGITSFKLVEKVRRMLGNEKAGHTGTLDPLASGLMMLTIGKATKILPYIVSHTKEYVAVLKLGFSTDTLDVTGTVTAEKEIVPIDKAQVEKVLKEFLGKSQQLPPMYSAKKVNGRKLYEYARNNVEIERKPADIEIFEIELISIDNDEIRFRTLCSAGTYIRTLCQEIAYKLNNEGCMKELIRSGIDRYSLEDSYTLDDIEKGNYALLDSYEVLNDYQYVEMEDLTDVLNGKPLRLERSDDVVFITNDHRIIAAYQKDGDVYRCKRGLW